MKINFLILLTIICWGVKSQPAPLWSSPVGSGLPNYFTDMPKMKFDSNGNLIVCGNFKSQNNGNDILVVKYSQAGNIIWLKTFNGPTNLDDVFAEFQVDGLNNIYIVGNTGIGNMNTDMLALKFDTNGNLLWSNTYNGYASRLDAGSFITLDPMNNSYIAGVTDVDTTSWRKKIVIRKIDPAGNTIWTCRYGTDSLGQYYPKTLKFAGNDLRMLGIYFPGSPQALKYVVTKQTASGSFLFANEAVFTRGISCGHISAAGDYYFGAVTSYKVTKINSSGFLDWTDSVGTNLPFNVTADEVRALTTDASDNLYVTGRHYCSYNNPVYTNGDILTNKYSPSGTKIWSKRYEFMSQNTCDIGNSIFLDANLNVYVGGESQESPLNNYNYVALQYDNSGFFMGTIRFDDGFSGDDAISDIVVDQAGSIYVTGLTENVFSQFCTTTQKYGNVITGAKEVNDVREALQAFPNPTSDFIVIENPGSENISEISVFDMSGRWLSNLQLKPLSGNSVSADLRKFDPGLYYIRITAEGSKGQYFQKICISR